MCIHCKLFEDEIKPHKDLIDSLLYSMSSRLKEPVKKPVMEWKRIPLKGVGDNDGYFELTLRR